MKGVHGPGPYFDGPGPWTRSTEGVHVLYFPQDTCPVCEPFRFAFGSEYFIIKQTFDIACRINLGDVSVSRLPVVH